MSAATFTPNPWGTLRNAPSAAALRSVAADASEEQLILFHQRIEAAVTELADERGLARDVAEWTVTQGKRSWWTVLTKAAKAPAAVPSNAWSALQVIEEVYRERSVARFRRWSLRRSGRMCTTPRGSPRSGT